MKILVITVSDRAARGEYEDLSGPAIEKVLKGTIDHPYVFKQIISDEPDELAAAFINAKGMDVILTTGGTGLTARDNTPEVTAEFIEKEVPGIAEMLRTQSYKQSPAAVLSRGIAGIKNQTLIINLPGSPKAARYCTEILIPVLKQAMQFRK